MRKMQITRTAGALALAAGLGAATGCSDFLSGPALTENPNNPTQLTRPALLLVAAQAGLATQQEGQLARWAGMYTGHFSGVGRQQLSYQNYSINENETTAYFSRVYTGGGLVDLLELQRIARSQSDSATVGVGMILEGLTMGTAASLWGDLPYSEAGQGQANLTPKLDEQREVYARVIAKLDTGSQWIVKTGITNAGPGLNSIIYTGGTPGSAADIAARANWARAANTLRARYWMHLGELEGNAAYTNAIAAALQGISAADGSQDFRTVHTASAGEQNLWWRFLVNDRAGDLAAGQRLVSIMQTRPASNGIADPRLATYFTTTTASATCPGGFRGGDENGSGPCFSNVATARNAQGFRQPLITYVENELILAEAYARTGQEPLALTRLNNARRAAGFTAAQDIPATFTGQALLNAIAEEKYVAMFQNIEVWNDYKRTCYPAINPPSGFTQELSRLPYGFAERNGNPNIPTVDLFARNDNDPNPCP